MTLGDPMIPSEAQRGALPPVGPWASPSSRNSAKNPTQAGGGSGRTGWANSRAQGQAGLTFFGRGDRVLSQAHTHAHTHCTLPRPPHHQPTAAPGGHSTTRHTQGSHVPSRTQGSHTHTGVHTHRARTGDFGVQGGEASLLWLPKNMERMLDPFLGRDPVRKMARGGVLGPSPSPRAMVSQATGPAGAQQDPMPAFPAPEQHLKGGWGTL